MSWLKKLCGGGTTGGSKSPKMEVDGMSFDQLMEIAQGGFLHGIDDATRVRCLHRAASIAIKSNDPKMLTIANSTMLSFRNEGLIQ